MKIRGRLVVFPLLAALLMLVIGGVVTTWLAVDALRGALPRMPWLTEQFERAAADGDDELILPDIGGGFLFVVGTPREIPAELQLAPRDAERLFIASQQTTGVQIFLLGHSVLDTRFELAGGYGVATAGEVVLLERSGPSGRIVLALGQEPPPPITPPANTDPPLP